MKICRIVEIAVRIMLLLSLILTQGAVILGQGINNLWLMGYAGGGGAFNLDFSSGSLSTYATNRQMNMRTTNANIADTSGNLLFCSNGVYIMSWNNDTMFNGSGLNPSQYTQMGV